MSFLGPKSKGILFARLQRNAIFNTLSKKTTTTCTEQQERRGVPLSQIVRDVNSRSFSSNISNKSSNEVSPSQSSSETPKKSKRDAFAEFQGIDFNKSISERVVPKRDRYLAYAAGAFVSFWFLFQLYNQGDVVFKKNYHFDHPFGDSDSENDDDGFSDEEPEEHIEGLAEAFIFAEKETGVNMRDPKKFSLFK